MEPRVYEDASAYSDKNPDSTRDRERPEDKLYSKITNYPDSRNQ